MALTIKEISLQECLKKAGIPSLPTPFNPSDGTEWVRGIALVNKVGGISNYVLVTNTGGKTAITRDFGPCRAVVSIVAVYPYDKLGRLDTPKLRSDDDTIEFLSKNGHDADEIKSMMETDRATVDKYVKDVALKLAKDKLAEKDRINEMKSYSSRIKTSDGKRKKRQASKDRGENKEV